MSDKVVLITGASRGLGFEVARQLVLKEYTVILTARDINKATDACENLPGCRERIFARALDVTNKESVQSAAEFVKERFRKLDVLINNAGVFLDKNISAEHGDMFLIQKTLETNFYGAYRMIQAFLPMMKSNMSGRIINVSSRMGQLCSMFGNNPGYRVSKAALNALTKMLSAEISEFNIQVNSVCPGWVKTAMGGPGAPRTIQQGAETIVWLADGGAGNESGKMFSDKEEIPW